MIFVPSDGELAALLAIVEAGAVVMGTPLLRGAMWVAAANPRHADAAGPQRSPEERRDEQRALAWPRLGWSAGLSLLIPPVLLVNHLVLSFILDSGRIGYYEGALFIAKLCMTAAELCGLAVVADRRLRRKQLEPGGETG